MRPKLRLQLRLQPRAAEAALLALGALSVAHFALVHPAIGLGYLLAVPVFFGIGFLHGVDGTAAALAVLLLEWALVALGGVLTVWLVGGLVSPALVAAMVGGFAAAACLYLAGWVEGRASGLRGVDLEEGAEPQGGAGPAGGLLAGLLERLRPERRVELI